jgi:hypothetical protein
LEAADPVVQEVTVRHGRRWVAQVRVDGDGPTLLLAVLFPDGLAERLFALVAEAVAAIVALAPPAEAEPGATADGGA